MPFIPNDLRPSHVGLQTTYHIIAELLRCSIILHHQYSSRLRLSLRRAEEILCIANMEQCALLQMSSNNDFFVIIALKSHHHALLARLKSIIVSLARIVLSIFCPRYPSP